MPRQLIQIFQSNIVPWLSEKAYLALDITIRAKWNCKSCNLQKAEEISEQLDSTDFRTVFGFIIHDWAIISSCEIRRTESRGRFGTTAHPDFKSLDLNSRKDRADSVPCHSSGLAFQISQILNLDSIMKSELWLKMYISIFHGEIWSAPLHVPGTVNLQSLNRFW